ERGIQEALIPDFHGMAHRPVRIDFELRPALQPRIALARQGRSLLRTAGQEVQKSLEALAVIFEVGRELPQYRTELFLQVEYTRGQEIGERHLDVAQTLHMCDESRSFDREDEVGGRVGVPARIVLRS